MQKSTKNKYNKPEINTVAENSLKGHFVPYAKRIAKISFYLRRNSSHTLRRNVADPAFLQQAPASLVAAEAYSHTFPQRRLSSFRIDSGLELRNHYGPPQDQQNRDFAIQRSIPGNAGTLSIPGSIHFAQIPETLEAGRNSQTGSLARRPASLPVFQSVQANQFDFRFGFRCDYYLRRPGRREDWIQSQKTWKTILSSYPLFRISFPGILAWQFKTRQRRKFHRRYSFHQNLFEKSSERHLYDAHQIQDGLRILRESGDSLSRRKRMRLCHSSQTVFQYQKESPSLQFPTDRSGLGSRRISSQSTLELGSGTSFCSNPQTHPKGSGRSQGLPFCDQGLRISCLYHQSPNEPMENISFLQAKSNNREKYSGAALRLSPGQNSNGQLDFKRGLFPAHPFFCEHSPLVQETLSAARIPNHDLGHNPHRFHRYPGKAGQKTETEYCKITA